VDGEDQRKPANDNHSRNCRKVVADIPHDMLVTPHELALIETHFAAIIADILIDPANDNEAEAGPDKRSES